MLARYTLLSVGTLLAGHLAAQSYCAPTFPNGCFNWRNLSIEVGGSLWEFDGVDCSNGDHTSTVMSVDAGTATPMVVTNGVWCGCAVWVDMDQSNSFEEEENLYYNYNGADPSQSYAFDLEIPESVPTGSYRMRVIAPWGSDGFTEGGQNGFGPCGAYQYGNYTDLTLNVIGAAQVQEVAAEGLWVGPNPGDEQLRIQVPQGLRSLQVIAMDGRVVTEQSGNKAPWLEVDMRSWPTGNYVVRAITGTGVLQARWVKQ